MSVRFLSGCADVAYRYLIESGIDVERAKKAARKSGNHGIIIYSLDSKTSSAIRKEMHHLGGDFLLVGDNHGEIKAVLLGTEDAFSSLAEILEPKGGDFQNVSFELNQALELFNRPPRIIGYGDERWDLSTRTHIMGVLNVTPDSFSDGGKFYSTSAAVMRALEMHTHGADFIDVGGESTRPGAEPVPENEELRRILPIIERLAGEDITVSVDTYKSSVAREAVKAGAAIINDISGVHFDREIATVAAEYGVMLVIMHIKGSPRTMQENPQYDDLMGEIIDYLQEGIELALDAGVARHKIIIDPGIGFGKRIQDNLQILTRLKELKILDCPILVGPSRKSFIGKLLEQPIGQRMWGTGAACSVAALNGADIVRVHDANEMGQVVAMTDYLSGKRSFDE